jgi:hypothetical protein
MLSATGWTFGAEFCEERDEDFLVNRCLNVYPEATAIYVYGPGGFVNAYHQPGFIAS